MLLCYCFSIQASCTCFLLQILCSCFLVYFSWSFGFFASAPSFQLLHSCFHPCCSGFLVSDSHADFFVQASCSCLYGFFVLASPPCFLFRILIFSCFLGSSVFRRVCSCFFFPASLFYFPYSFFVPTSRFWLHISCFLVWFLFPASCLSSFFVLGSLVPASFFKHVPGSLLHTSLFCLCLHQCLNQCLIPFLI